MTPLAAYAAAHADGMALLADISWAVARSSVDELAAELGLKAADIREKAHAYRILRKYTRQARKLSVDVLVLVSKWVRKGGDPETLLRAVKGASYAEACDIVREVTPRKITRPSVSIAARPDHNGRRRITFALADADCTAMQALADESIQRMRAKDSTLTYGQALHRWISRQLTSSVTGGRHYRPALLLPVDPSLIYERGTLVTSDGAQINPLELLGAQLADTGWALQTALDADGVAHIVTVAGIQDTRFSTGDHRMITHLEAPCCVWPGCTRAAVNCQAHHIQEWAKGGKTSWENLAPLCAVHNGTNGDKHGRIVRGNGGYPGLQRRPGDPVQYSTNPLLTSGWRGFTYDYYARLRTR